MDYDLYSNSMSHLVKGNTINSENMLSMSMQISCAMEIIYVYCHFEKYWNEINCGIKINVRRKINA